MDIPSGIRLEIGEHWSIRLPGLGSAGYQWTCRVEGDSGVARVTLTSLPPPSLPPAGEPPDNVSADTLVEIQALRPGAVTIELISSRPWERDRPPLQQHTVRVTVVA